MKIVFVGLHRKIELYTWESSLPEKSIIGKITQSKTVKLVFS